MEKYFEEMSFLQQLLFLQDTTTTEKLQNVLVNEEVCKMVSPRNVKLSTFLVRLSPLRHNSPVLDMKNFVTKHFYSYKWQGRRKHCPGSLDSSADLNLRKSPDQYLQTLRLQSATSILVTTFFSQDTKTAIRLIYVRLQL